jgi:aminopeptidase C
MCHYSETYTEDLKLGYSSFVKFWDLLEENNWFGKKEEFMKLYDEQLDERHKVDESL